MSSDTIIPTKKIIISAKPPIIVDKSGSSDVYVFLEGSTLTVTTSNNQTYTIPFSTGETVNYDLPDGGCHITNIHVLVYNKVRPAHYGCPYTVIQWGYDKILHTCDGIMRIRFAAQNARGPYGFYVESGPECID